MACPLSALVWFWVLNRRDLQVSQQPVKALQHWWTSSSRVCLLSLKTLEKQGKNFMTSYSGKRGLFEMHYLKTTGFQQCWYPAIILCQSVCWEEVTCYFFIFPVVLTSFCFSCFQMEAAHKSKNGRCPVQGWVKYSLHWLGSSPALWTVSVWYSDVA